MPPDRCLPWTLSSSVGPHITALFLCPSYTFPVACPPHAACPPVLTRADSIQWSRTCSRPSTCTCREPGSQGVQSSRTSGDGEASVAGACLCSTVSSSPTSSQEHGGGPPSGQAHTHSWAHWGLCRRSPRALAAVRLWGCGPWALPAVRGLCPRGVRGIPGKPH